MRRREISASFWTDERVWDLESDAARLLLPGLWQIADRDGRLLDRPFDIGVQCRPWAPREVPALIDHVVEAGLLYRYEVDGVRCLAFPPKAWKKHQRPHPNERDSVLPEIPRELLVGTPDGAPRSYVRSTKVLPTSVRPSGSSEPSGSSGPSGPSGSSGGAPAAGKKPKKLKAQAELPQIVPPPPPREPSRGEVLFEKFRDARDNHLEELGAEPSPDAVYSTVFVNKVFKGWSDLWAHVPFKEKYSQLGLTTGAEWRCLELFDAYFALDWPAKCVARVDGKDTATPQPYPFSALASGKVWRELAAKLWPDEAAQAGAA